jgi:hypothetical protein
MTIALERGTPAGVLDVRAEVQNAREGGSARRRTATAPPQTIDTVPSASVRVDPGREVVAEHEQPERERNAKNAKSTPRRSTSTNETARLVALVDNISAHIRFSIALPIDQTAAQPANSISAIPVPSRWVIWVRLSCTSCVASGGAIFPVRRRGC